MVEALFKASQVISHRFPSSKGKALVIGFRGFISKEKGTVMRVLISSRECSLIPHWIVATPLGLHNNMPWIGCGGTQEKQGFELPILLRT